MEIYYLSARGWDSKIKVSHGWFLLKAVRENLPHAYPLASDNFPAIFDVPWLE